MISKQIKGTAILLLLALTFVYSSGEYFKLNSKVSTQFSLTPPNKTSIMIIDFTQPTEITHWQIVNDDVMGGISKGFLKSNSDFGTFSGEIF